LPPLSPALAAALDATRSAKPPCSHCLASRGLCTDCAAADRSILPQLAVPPWVRLMAAAKPPAPARSADVVSVMPPLNTPGRGEARRRRRAAEFARKVAMPARRVA
jgi:hypothetical protein